MTTREAIQIGQRALEAKQRLQHGDFMAWITREFNLTHEAIRLCMNAARRTNRAGIHLDDEAFDNIVLSALYWLCKPSTSLDAFTQAIAFARDGVTVTCSMAEDIIEGKKNIRPEEYRAYQLSMDFIPSPFDSEEELRQAVVNDLERKGVKCTIEVECDIGFADVVTRESIYEVKNRTTADTLFKAIGQVLMYREIIDRTLSAKIICTFRSWMRVERMIAVAKDLGVEIIPWEES